MDDEILPEGVGTSDWIEAAVIIGVAIGVSIAINIGSQRAIARLDSDRFAGRFVGRLLAFFVVMAGLIYSLSAVNVQIGPLLGALGIGGLALAFALQDIIENFAAGVILQIRRPMQRGDQIMSEDHEGTVEEVNIRSTIIRTFDGETVYLPNADVLKNPIVNYTERGSRRTTLAVGVSYDADLEVAKGTILDVIASVDGVLEDPPPEAYVHEFADSSINIAIRFWHRPEIAELWRVRDEIAIGVKKALDEAGISIPFPQRVVRVTNGDISDPS